MCPDDPRLSDPVFAAGFSAGVLQSADLGTQVLVVQLQATVERLQATIDEYPRLVQELHGTLGRLEEVGALFRETELGSPYWKTRV